MPDRQISDMELRRAYGRHLQSATTKRIIEPADPPCDRILFGQEGQPLTVGTIGLLVFPRTLELVEWTVWCDVVGTVTLGLEWSPWVKPPAWQNIVGTKPPGLIGDNPNDSDDVLAGWTKRLFYRKEALRVSVTAVDGVISFGTLVLHYNRIDRWDPALLP